MAGGNPPVGLPAPGGGWGAAGAGIPGERAAAPAGGTPPMALPAPDGDWAAPRTEMRDMAKKWYVVHTYSGFENKVKKSLEEHVRQHADDKVEFDDKEDGKIVRKAGRLQDCFGEVLIPMEQVVEMVKGEKKTSKRKFFPGYILVQMQMADSTWHMVKSTPKVTGFVGS